MPTLSDRVTSLAAAVRDKFNSQAQAIAAVRPAYPTGDGGVVSQATSKATAVTLNKRTGVITLNAAALAAGAVVTFTLTNSTLAVDDMILATHHSGGTVGPYLINARVTAAGAGSISVRNTSAASLSEAIAIKFAVVKTVIA